jgi:uncharacterized membrane protein (UPF0127 family)
MIWLANDGRVVYINDNATPESYPKVFVNVTLARYVLEVPAGYAKAHGVKIGDKALI